MLVFGAPRGTHQLEDCASGKNPIADPEECGSQRYELREDPFDWTLGEGATVKTRVTLVLSNIATTPTDIYLDGKLARSLEPHTYYIMDAAPGARTFQNCPGGVTPEQQDSDCAEPIIQELRAAVEIWKVGD
ncbi:MAG: hypothetical protein HY741_11390 [Chloroflexi bacterium]|nr:hypothetical protein [Chloroflexota bacterium]